jgi:uncharacterized protein (TIGR03435 family)
MRSWQVIILTTATLWAQPSLKYEVTSVKHNPDGPEMSFSYNIAADGFYSARNVTLWNLIRFAYNLRDLQIQNAPDWFKKQGFDIQGKPAVPVSREQSLSMLQALLEDRFHLKFRYETRDQPAYLLTLADRGKLQPAEEAKNGTLRMGDIRSAMTLAGLCQVLEFELDRPLVDRTGLSGAYSINLRYASERTAPGAADPSLPALSTALREQLGLRLESGRAPLDTFVIDGAEQPSEN